jgi:chromosome segregation ATPase
MISSFAAAPISDSTTDTNRAERRKTLRVGTEKKESSRGSLSNTEKEVAAINSEYKKIMDRVKNIDKIVEEIEDNRTEFVQDVVTFEKEYDILEKEARDLNPLPPLTKITDMLERWSREPVHSQEDLKRFANELWVSLDDYEREMRDQVNGHQIILAIKEHKFMTNIEWLKNKFGFYLELYEQSFIEVKLKYRK